MERWGSWFRGGLASLGMSRGAAGGGRAASGVEVQGRESAPPLPYASRIVYPLRVDGWNAVGEHLFQEQEYGVAVRYAHGHDRDRWIDVYFYPAGMLSGAEFDDAARAEAELIVRAHEEAGHTGFDMGPPLHVAPGTRDRGAVADAIAVDLQYAADGTTYSSAMVLLLHELYFVKARYSLEQGTLTRVQTREALEAFAGQLRSQLSIASVGTGWGDGVAFADRRKPGSSMREIRLDYAGASAEMPALAARSRRKDVMVA